MDTAADAPDDDRAGAPVDRSDTQARPEAAAGTSDASVSAPRDRLIFRLAVAIAAAPIAISALRNGLAHWYPTRDAALTTVYVNDVFSAHTPLIGLPTSFSKAADLHYSYLGAFHMYLLAVPVRLLGVTWGLVVGMGLLNLAWFVTAMWLIRRRVGYRTGLLGCVFGASLVWTLGSQVLIDPTPVQTGALAFFAFCVAAWSVADRDLRALVPFAILTNHLFLLHPKYVLVVPAVTVVVVVVSAPGVLRCLRDRSSAGRARRRRLTTRAGTAVAVTALMWTAPIAEQLLEPGGNLRAWFTSMLRSEGTSAHSASHAFRVASSTVTTWPLWFRPSVRYPNFDAYGPTVSLRTVALGFLVVAALGIMAAWRARRRSDATVSSGLLIAAVAWTAWIVTVWRSPGSGYNQHYLLSLWPLATFVWFAVALGLLRGIRSDADPPGNQPGRTATRPVSSVRLGTATRIGALGAVAVFAAATIPIANFRAATPQQNVAPAQRIRHVILADIEPGGPVVVSSPSYPARKYFPVVLLALQEKGIDFRVLPGWDSTVYRSFRTYDPDEAGVTRRIRVLNIPPPGMTGAELIASGGPPLREPFALYLERRDRLVEWARSTPVLRAPASPGLDPDRRDARNTFLTEIQQMATARNRTIFENVDSIDALLGLEIDDLTRILDVPGLTRDEFREWLEDQRRVLARDSWFLVLDEP